jgi:hypothetical protein
MPITGDQPGKGSYQCLACGQVRHLKDHETLPPCEKCGRLQFSQIGHLPQGFPSSCIPEKTVFPRE